MVNVFDYFWKPNSLFSKFCVNCLLIFYLYTVIVVIWKMLMEPVNAPGRWWPCACLKCVSGLRRLEDILEFLRCIHVFDLVRRYGSDINEGIWLQLLFYFIVMMGIVFPLWKWVFSAVFQVSDWSFLVLHFDGNVCNWNPKVIWPRMDWFWGFLLENGFFRWLHICVDWNLQELLNCSFLTTSINAKQIADQHTAKLDRSV